MSAGQQTFDEIKEELGARLATEYLQRLRGDAAIIPIEDAGPWSAWASVEQTTALGRASGAAYQEVVAAIEGKLDAGERLFRLRMKLKPDSSYVSLWSMDQEQKNSQEQDRALKARGLKRVYHHEFLDAEGKTRHQSIWEKQD